MGDDGTYSRLSTFASITSATASDNTALISAIDTWKKFYDTEYIPLRLEQSILYAFLTNEQYDLHKKNEVIVDHQSAQLKVIDRIVNDFYNKSFSSLRNYQSIDYKINQMNSNIHSMKYTFMLIALLSMLIGATAMGKVKEQFSGIIAITLIIAFCLLQLMKYRQSLYRNKYDWHKIYWSSPESSST
jgi:hypothetical protein